MGVSGEDDDMQSDESSNHVRTYFICFLKLQRKLLVRYTPSRYH